MEKWVNFQAKKAKQKNAESEVIFHGYLKLFMISETSSAMLESPALEHTEFMWGL